MQCAWAVLHCGPGRYPSSIHANTPAVELRAATLQSEYEGKARKADVTYGTTAPGTDGPVLQRLRSFLLLGLVVGHFGEWSTDLRALVQVAAEVAAPRARALFGVRALKCRKAMILWHARREISWAVLNAAAKLRLDRAAFVGPTAAAANRNSVRAQGRCDSVTSPIFFLKWPPVLRQDFGLFGEDLEESVRSRNS